LVDVSNLVVAAHYNQVGSDGSSTLHVFAHTRGTPPKWYYRTRTGLTVETGAWSAWQPLNLDIATDNVVPFVWDQRLHLMWTIFKPQTEKAGNSSVPSGGGGTSPKAQSYWSIELATSELSAGQWQAKKVLAEKLFTVKVNPLASPEVDRPPAAFTVRASQDPSFNLNINVYYNARPGEPAEVIWGWTIGPFGSQFLNFTVVPFGPVAQLASAQQTLPDAPLSVTEDLSLLPASSLIDLSKDPSYSLVTPGSLTGSLNSPTGFGFSGQDLVYGGYWTQNPGSVPLYVLAQTTTSGSSQ